MAFVPTVGDLHFKRNESRLFMTIWMTVHLTDAFAMAGLAVRGNLKLIDKQAMCIVCAAFPFEILVPIVHPMMLTVSNVAIDHIILEVKPRGTTPIPGNHTISQFTELHHRFMGIVFLRFYEQHRRHVQAVYGTNTQQWPQVIQFAWALRNGIAHHGGRLNFENPNYPPITWHTLVYSPTDNGRLIFGSHFTVSDLLFFLIELSDAFDAIRAPFPSD